MTTNGTWQFHVGMEVVCIDGVQAGHSSMPFDLIEGQVYRIRWVGMTERYADGEYLGVRLEGIDRGICPAWGDVDPPFRAKRFRPVEKDRLSSLRSLLAGNGPAPSIEEPCRPVTVKEEESV